MNSVRTRKTHRRGKPKKKVEPLGEGLAGKKKGGRKYAQEEVELIKRRYTEFVEEGLNDKQICKRIGEELRRSASSVIYKIKRMRENKMVGENPNKGWKEFSEEEIAFIKRRYSELVKKGLNDKQIAKKISKELRRNSGSLLSKINGLIENRELEKNPNKKDRKNFSRQEINLIIKKYHELVGKELNDHKISRKIAKELDRNHGSVYIKIKRLRKDGKIGENPNRKEKKGRYTDEEIELIVRRYLELVQEGMNDKQIAKRIAKELERSVDPVYHKLRKIRKDGKIGENPNRKEKKGRFSDEEIEIIKRRYGELVEDGLNYEKISKIIGEEIGRSAGSVKEKIRKMREDGEIGENPNRQDTKGKYTDEEIELIRRRYAELAEEGLNDHQISKKVGKELGRSAGSIDTKIRKLKRAGELADAEALREKQDILGVAEALEEFGD